MSVRLATSTITQRAINSMLEQQNRVATSQLQLSSGKRILTPSDDPAGSVRILDLQRSLETLGQYQSNADRAQGRLELEEATLSSVDNILIRAKELAVQGNNDSNSMVDKQAIAQEIKQIRDGLFDLANTRDGTGEYLFAGFRTDAPPVTNAGGGNYDYVGDLGQRNLRISSDRTVADGDNGFDIFFNVQTAPYAEVTGVAATAFTAISAGDLTINGISVGALSAAADAGERADQLRDAINAIADQTGVQTVNDTSGGLRLSSTTGADIDIAHAGASSTLATTGLTAAVTLSTSDSRNILETVNDLAAALDANQRVDRYLGDLDLALENVLQVRTKVGGRLNAIGSQNEINQDFKLAFESQVSQERDLDYASTIANFERQMVSLQAAQKSYVQIQSLSLFDYI
ncbi:MAG: flagellar hook-associated protein 3 [Gammaproteobacteria bacterium]|nr:flagellar hook-associated protein 3 [Gammaproteobacteria bacterium]